MNTKMQRRLSGYIEVLVYRNIKPGKKLQLRNKKKS